MRQMLGSTSRWHLAMRHALAGAVCLAVAGCGGGSDDPQRPNILVIVADDMGYSDIGAFGSEIATPNLDSISREGRILTRFYTAPACSPTRGMLLSGADSHRIGLGHLETNTLTLVNERNAPFGVEFGFENIPEAYAGHLLDKALSMPELLRDAGYHTYMTGKWHLAFQFGPLVPPSTSPLTFRPASFPNARGFERSFALQNGAASHLPPRPELPTIYDDATYTVDDVVISSKDLPADFYSTKTFTDKIIEYIESNRGDDKPFFAYVAYTAPHWPLQAPDADLAAQVGRYDEGYEVIRARRLEKMKQLGVIPTGFVANPGLPSVAEGGRGKKRWSELTPDERAVQARAMEAYAAMVASMDQHIGRIIQHLKNTGQYDNTLIFFMSDNGADSNPSRLPREADNSLANIGRPSSTVSYGERWAEVSTAPFRLWKTLGGAEGAVSVPALVKLPRQHKPLGPLRAATQVKDLLPTMLELAGVRAPIDTYKGRPIVPISGTSLVGALTSNDEFPQIRLPGTALALEFFGQGYVLQDHWKLSLSVAPGETPSTYATVPWRLYDMDKDRGETRDLARNYPEVVGRLTTEWERYVQSNRVLMPVRPPTPKRDPNAL